MICLIHGDMIDSKRGDILFASSISLHNDTSRIRYDLSPYSCSLLSIIQIDCPGINAMYHPISHNTFVPQWLPVNYDTVCCNVFTIMIYKDVLPHHIILICCVRRVTLRLITPLV